VSLPNENGENPGELNVLVLGVGNMLLADEGTGGRVVEELHRQFRIPESLEVIDGGTMGMDLMSYIDGRSHLIVIDAVNTGTGKPGHTVRLELEDPPSFFRNMVSPHQLGLAEVLGVAAMTECMPPNIIVIGVEPASLETSLELSPEVEAKIPEMVEMVRKELDSLGYPLEPVA
jgi:hydrogenase maturation protease